MINALQQHRKIFAKPSRLRKPCWRSSRKTGPRRILPARSTTLQLYGKCRDAEAEPMFKGALAVMARAGGPRSVDIAALIGDGAACQSLRFCAAKSREPGLKAPKNRMQCSKSLGLIKSSPE